MAIKPAQKGPAPDLTPDARYESPSVDLIELRLRNLRLVRLEAALRAHKAAAENFVAKVDAGYARSVVSYAEFVHALKMSEGL